MRLKSGDKVRIINYGHHIFDIDENGEFRVIDLVPEIVGKIGVIDRATETQTSGQYSIIGIPGKTAWYDDKQLELIN